MTDSPYLSGLDIYSIAESATLIEQSVHKLRNAIMRGHLRPGQKLIEASLCEKLDISRASLREALRALETEKLIEFVPNRGSSVAKLGIREIEEIHEVWALLTSQAVADFTQVAKRTDIAKLEEALANLSEHNRADTPLGELAVINSFFSVILRKCGNRVLMDMVLSLVARVNFLRAQALLHHQGRVGLYSQEIKEILRRIKASDVEGARSATRQHIATACTAAKQCAADYVPVPASPGMAPEKKLAKAGRARS